MFEIFNKNKQRDWYRIFLNDWKSNFDFRYTIRHQLYDSSIMIKMTVLKWYTLSKLRWPDLSVIYKSGESGYLAVDEYGKPFYPQDDPNRRVMFGNSTFFELLLDLVEESVERSGKKM